MKRLLLNPWLARILEVTLGGVFIYAAFHKIADPPAFAKDVYNYRLVPNPLVNPFSIFLPWMEVVAGTALIAGWKCRKGAAALVGAMLLLFVTAIGWNLLRGHLTDCGCFEGAAQKTPAEKLSHMQLVLGRDVLMLAGVAWIFLIHRARGRNEPPIPEKLGQAIRAPAA